MTRYADTQVMYVNNDPPVKIGQIWKAFSDKGELNRSIRILAPYPVHGINEQEYRQWIYEDCGGRLKVDIGRLSLCPEFNLRFVFTLEMGV